jgi:hypothetical protein
MGKFLEIGNHLTVVVNILQEEFMKQCNFPTSICQNHPYTVWEQIEWIKDIVKRINNGEKMVIFTNSDHVIRMLNNSIMIHGNTDKENVKREMRAYDLTDELVLSSTYVKVICATKKGTIEEIEVNENGFTIKDIDDVINYLNGSNENLFYEINYNNANA